MSVSTTLHGYKVEVRHISCLARSWSEYVQKTKRRYWTHRDWGVVLHDDLDPNVWFGDRKFSDFGGATALEVIAKNEDYKFWDIQMDRKNDDRLPMWEPAKTTSMMFFWRKEDFNKLQEHLERRWSTLAKQMPDIPESNYLVPEQFAWAGYLYWYRMIIRSGWNFVKIWRDSTVLFEDQIMECPQDWETLVRTLESKGMSRDHVLEVTRSIRLDVPERPWTL